MGVPQPNPIRMPPAHQTHRADVTQILETCPGTYSAPDSAIVERQQFIYTALKRNQFSSLAQPFPPPLKMPLVPNSAKKPSFDAFSIKTQLNKHLFALSALGRALSSAALMSYKLRDLGGSMQPLRTSGLLVAEGPAADQKQQQHNQESTLPTSPAPGSLTEK